MNSHTGMRQNIVMTVVLAGVLLFGTPRMMTADGQQNSGSTDVLAEILPQDAGGEPFRQVVTDVVKYRLTRQGLAVVISSDRSITYEDESDAALLKTAEAAGAPIALSCRYASDGSQIGISLKWHETRSGAVTASATNKGSVDLQFDGVILAAMDTLLFQVKDRVTQLMAQKAEAARTTAAAAVQAATTQTREQPAGVAATRETPPQNGATAREATPQERAAGQVAAQGTEPQSAAGQVAAQGTEPQSAAAPQSLPRTEERSRELPPSGPAISLSAGVGGFLALGAAADYFTIGARPSFLGSVFFDAPMGRFGVGLFIAVNYFPAQGVVENSNNLLIPFGPDLRYEIAIGTLLAVRLRLTGGPAMLVMVTQNKGTLAKMLPFFAGGLGAEFHITPKIGLGASADYEAYFETPYPIMGVSPSVNVSLKL